MKPGDVIDSRYRVDRELGSGGMGFVLAVTDLRLGRPVALKLLHGEALTKPVLVARFEREARAAAMLKSEHVVRTLDVGRLPNDAPYIAMELLEGQDLEAVAKDHPLPCATAVDYILQACAAIAEAHAQGIVHRDLKPQNLFLASRGGGRPPIVKVLDFGISKVDADGHDLTRTNDIMGTPIYMAPEQLRSAKETDARTDLWALGAILYRLVTGRLPFEGDTIATLTYNIVSTEPIPLRQLRPDAPEELVRAVARCLQKDRAARCPSVAELAKLLDPKEESPFTKTLPLDRPLTASSSTPVVHVGGAPSEEPMRATTRRRLITTVAVVAGTAVAAVTAYIAWPKPRAVPEEPVATPLPSSTTPTTVAISPSAVAPSAPSTVVSPRKSGHRRGRPPASPASPGAGPAPAAPAAEDDSLPDMRK